MKGSPGLAQYLKEIKRYPLLSAEATKQLIRKVHKRRDRAARNKLIRANLRLVIPIARRYQYRGLPLQDLIEEGNIGLMKAINRYDPAKARFSTYATWWIKQSIIRALMTSARTIRLPCHIIEVVAKWKSASLLLSQKLGRTPETSEICQELNISAESLKLFKKTLQSGLMATRQTSLDMFTDAAIPPHDTIQINLNEPFNVEETEWLGKLLNSINPREALVLKLRYGLEEGQPSLTLREIGHLIGYTAEMVRQIEKKALRKLHYVITRLGS